jgi:hypothetical protein
LVAIIGLVLLFDFANQLGTLATVMGLAPAGIALTLQNVILSPGNGLRRGVETNSLGQPRT